MIEALFVGIAGAVGVVLGGFLYGCWMRRRVCETEGRVALHRLSDSLISEIAKTRPGVIRVSPALLRYLVEPDERASGRPLFMGVPCQEDETLGRWGYQAEYEGCRRAEGSR